MKYLQIKLDDAIHKDFKRKCVDNDTTMSEKVLEWIKKYLTNVC